MFKGKTKRGIEVNRTLGFLKEKKEATWVVVAGRAGAKLYQTINGGKKLELVEEVPHAAGRMLARDLVTDQPGRSFDGGKRGEGSGARSSLGSVTTPTEVAALEFANVLSTMLEKGRTTERYGKLVLVSEPGFLGLLRRALSSKVAEKIVATHAKDYAFLTPNALENELTRLLQY